VERRYVRVYTLSPMGSHRCSTSSSSPPAVVNKTPIEFDLASKNWDVCSFCCLEGMINPSDLRACCCWAWLLPYMGPAIECVASRTTRRRLRSAGNRGRGNMLASNCCTRRRIVSAGSRLGTEAFRDSSRTERIRGRVSRWDAEPSKQEGKNAAVRVVVECAHLHLNIHFLEHHHRTRVAVRQSRFVLFSRLNR